MITVGAPGPGTIGIPCIVRSPSRAAGNPPINTVMLPWAMPFGAGETHTMPPGIAFATAAGRPPMITVGTPAAGVIGPPTWGMTPSTRAQSATSPTLRAGPVGMRSR